MAAPRVFRCGVTKMTEYTDLMESLTLDQIRAAGLCKSGFAKLLAGLGYMDGRYDPYRRITIGDVAAINGAPDALWCLRLVDDPRLRVRAIIPAVDRVAKLTTDARVHKCIAALHKWLDGDEHVDLLAVEVAGAAEALATDATEGADATEVAEWVARSPSRAEAWAARASVRAMLATRWVAKSPSRAATWASWAAVAAALGAAWDGASEADGAKAAAAAERAAQVNDLVALFGRSP